MAMILPIAAHLRGLNPQIAIWLVSLSICIRPVGLMEKVSASGAGGSKFESWMGHVLTREPAQAGNKACRTEHYLQWWENSPEWNTETSAADKRHNSSLHYVKARSGTRILVCFECWMVRCVDWIQIHVVNAWHVFTRHFHE